jgi:hypothetical protein
MQAVLWVLFWGLGQTAGAVATCLLLLLLDGVASGFFKPLRAEVAAQVTWLQLVYLR